jgi:hypothetical protein
MQRESVCRACSMLDPYMLPDLHTNIKHIQIQIKIRTEKSMDLACLVATISIDMGANPSCWCHLSKVPEICRLVTNYLNSSVKK